MPIRASAASLRQFPVVETHDPAIMQEMLVTQYGASRFEVHDATDFSGRMYYAPLGAVSLGVCAYSTPVSLEFPESGFVRLQIAIAGSAAMVIGNRATEISVAQAAITPAHRANRIDFGAGFQQLFVRIEIGALERKLVALLGARPRRPIEFSWALPDGQPHFRSFKEMIAFAARQLALTSANPPVLLLSEIEQALIAGFLETVPHSYSDALQRQPADIAATQVRRVEEYIDVNWQQPITVENLAHTTGISARSIFNAFKRARGYTPMSYVKTVRLRNAHALLTSPSEATTVTDVAYQCGFSNHGHFATDYQRIFGELPSVTLRKAKR